MVVPREPLKRVITIYAALGFTLFGAFAGVLLTIRWWYHSMKTAGAVRGMVVAMRNGLSGQGREKVFAELFHSGGGLPRCPLCEAPVAYPLAPDPHVSLENLERSYQEEKKEESP